MLKGVMKIYFNNFFNDLDLTPFYNMFKMVFNENIELGTFEDSDILFESIFGDNTHLYKKKWKFSFLFIGESDRRFPLWMVNRMHTIKDYSCVLKGEKNNNNIINFPLYLLYSYCYNFTHKFIKNYIDKNRWKEIANNKITRIPPKNVCVIISNSHDSEGRNFFCEKLEKKVKIDYAGNYKNNTNRITSTVCCSDFVEFVSQYKIIITMENSKNNDYITEKILHGFSANTIPVYWGADNICEYFNEKRFINVKSFNESDIDNAIDRILLLLNDDEKYLDMVNEDIYLNNRIPLSLFNISNNIKKLLNIENKYIKKFITFGGPTENFHNSVKRICKEVEDIDFFDEIIGFTEIDLKNDSNFWEKHQHFIENNRRGYGYWIWKSYLIKKELDKMNENDILIYTDCGCQINKNGKKRLLEYIDILNNNKENYGIISFQLEYKELQYTKKAIFNYFNSSEEEKKLLQCLDGIQIIKKNNHSINIINKWFESCKYHLLNDETHNEEPSFIENRHDQSILSIIVNRYGSIKLTDETYFPGNWDIDGKEYPIWARRIK